MTKHPLSCSLRKVVRLSAMVGMIALSFFSVEFAGLSGESRRCRMHARAAPMPAERAGRTGSEGGSRHGIVCARAASRRKFLQFLAGSPLLAGGALSAFAGEGPTPGTKLPDPLMWAPDARRRSHRLAQGRDQCLRFRAGLPQERPARAFRLHGVRHRRRSHAARQSRGVPEIPAAAAAARRREQGRYERRHSRREIQFAHRAGAGGRPKVVP